MKCERCPKPATLHITEIEGGVPTEVHLCESCAKEYLAQDLAGQASGAGGTKAEPEFGADLVCPRCGLSFAEFRRSGRLGCADDYEVFAEPLESLYQSVHGATQHMGKTPKRSSQDVQRQQELIRLRRELREAIAREEYEQAAKLRDMIQEREGH